MQRCDTCKTTIRQGFPLESGRLICTQSEDPDLCLVVNPRKKKEKRKRGH